MSYKIFETHAHYEDEAFDEDRRELIMSLPENGISYVVNVGSSVETSKECIRLASRFEHVYAAVGIHPEHAEQGMSAISLDKINTFLKEDKCVALGEIGLDYHYEDTDEVKNMQYHSFTRQMDMALSADKPIIVHSRDAAKDTMDYIREFYGDFKSKNPDKKAGVVHCYSGSAEDAVKYIDMGFYIGVGGVVTFKNSKKLKKVVEEISLEDIVIETDAPYMAPTPFRGKRNSSLYLPYVIEKIAAIKGVEPSEVAEITFNNGKRLYRL
ncbi:MAG: TatD family hydrolase [Lachnospiraceae bacterium]|nr:TatD family hydrolase [Lachnospiraceae bacterium]